MPNIALIESFQKNQTPIKISYIGSYAGLEKKLLSPYNIDFYSIQTGKLRRYFDLQNFIDFFRVPIGFIQSLFLLKKLKPNLVFSKGGFVALPVVFAARCLSIPIIIHESDSIPGLTTKLTSRLANQVWADNKSLQSYFRVKFKQVKLPIRNFLQDGKKDYFITKCNFNPSKKTILVMGGSLGAKAINDFVVENIDYLTTSFNILHICGREKMSALHKNKPSFAQFEYLDQEMSHAYAAADYILTRAGASALAELSALSKKAILIPLSTAQSRGEQIINAKQFILENSGVIIDQQNLTLPAFKQAVTTLDQQTLPKATSSQFNLNVFSDFLDL